MFESGIGWHTADIMTLPNGTDILTRMVLVRYTPLGLLNLHTDQTVVAMGDPDSLFFRPRLHQSQYRGPLFATCCDRYAEKNPLGSIGFRFVTRPSLRDCKWKSNYLCDDFD
jgi:hypothetical protein